MIPRASIWLKTVYARTWVRTKSIYGEPLWVAVNVGFPFFTSLALSLLYSSAGLKSGIGFAFLGGVMVSFWGNVLWSMASQFNWDKLQAIALVIPLAVGMDALQRTLFSLNSSGVADLTLVYRDIFLLAVMGITLLFAASKALKILEEKGRRAGTIAVRLR